MEWSPSRPGIIRLAPIASTGGSASASGFDRFIKIDQAPVTNAEFLQFVDATGYQTVSEQPLIQRCTDLPPEEQFQSVVFLPLRQRWIAVNLSVLVGPDRWRRLAPSRARHHSRGIDAAPHVAFEDALAYADWAGKRLPTDEWEVAAGRPR